MAVDGLAGVTRAPGVRGWPDGERAMRLSAAGKQQARRRGRRRHAAGRLLAAALCLLAAVWADDALAQSRLKDLVNIEGVRSNQLVGYGLVVGLNGTGDTLKDGSFTQQSLQAMLNRLGVKPTNKGLVSKNVAAVMVTAELPPFGRQGTRIDVNVSALGDADNLLGGTLLVTPLLGADSEVYAVAQGQVTVAGFQAKGQAETVTKGVPTTGRIANGAIVEREVGFEMANMETVKLALRNPDLTTARRIAQAINAHVGGPAARPSDPTTVHVNVPDQYRGNVVNLLTDLEQLSVEPDMPARIVIDDTSGIVVMGEEVRVSTVAIAHGNLTIRITEAPQVSQPEPFSERGRTVVVPRTGIDVDEGGDRGMAVVQGGVTLQELVNGLNALGVSPRDLIAILQAIKAAGALHADIEVM
jgi:flagellar P-ring protein precursor FlgI